MSYDFMKNAIKKQTQNGNEYTVKEFHGRLWKNKSENPKAPVVKGNMNVGGEEWQISLFKNEDGSFNIVTQEPYGKYHVGGEDYSKPPKSDFKETTTEKKENEFDDDIPF